MTRPQPVERLYLTDAEIADRLMSGEDRVARWKGAAAVLEKKGLPPLNALFGNRRYWPAVRDFLDRREGLASSMASSQHEKQENWSCLDRSQRTSAQKRRA